MELVKQKLFINLFFQYKKQFIFKKYKLIYINFLIFKN